jgi:hypothetical protein
MQELNEARNAGKRKSLRGIATNDLIFSAYMESNSPIFSQILDLYVPVGSAIADLTHIEIINELTIQHYICEDLFAAKRANKPGTRRVIKQRNARKNHSYFLAMTKMTRKPLENEDFGDALASYEQYVERFNDCGSHFDGVKLIDSVSNRLIVSAEIIYNDQKKTKEPKRKKKEDQGYER